jgi:putative PIN family toxin of toxin-antitoxin system
VRALLDPNILIASLLSPTGAPAQLVSDWLGGEFELIVSDALLAGLERALAYPKLRQRVPQDEAAAFATLLRHGAILAPDPPNPAHRSADRGDGGDDYLIALAEAERAVLVSGDRDVLALAGEIPIQPARAFLRQPGRRIVQSRTNPASLAARTTAHPALIPQEAGGSSRLYPAIPATPDANSPAHGGNPRLFPLSPQAP